jgi:hypothetical protein
VFGALDDVNRRRRRIDLIVMHFFVRSFVCKFICEFCDILSSCCCSYYEAFHPPLLPSPPLPSTFFFAPIITKVDGGAEGQRLAERFSRRARRLGFTPGDTSLNSDVSNLSRGNGGGGGILSPVPASPPTPAAVAAAATATALGGDQVDEKELGALMGHVQERFVVVIGDL